MQLHRRLLSFHPNQSKQTEALQSWTLQSLGLIEVSSPWEVFFPLPLLLRACSGGTRLFSLLMVQRALRRL